jgi:hypothetical protein
MRNTADVTGGRLIAVLLQFTSGVSTINPLFAFYDFHGRKGEVLSFYFVPDTTRDENKDIHHLCISIIICCLEAITKTLIRTYFVLHACIIIIIT